MTNTICWISQNEKMYQNYFFNIKKNFKNEIRWIRQHHKFVPSINSNKLNIMGCIVFIYTCLGFRPYVLVCHINFRKVHFPKNLLKISIMQEDYSQKMNIFSSIWIKNGCSWKCLVHMNENFMTKLYMLVNLLHDLWWVDGCHLWQQFFYKWWISQGTNLGFYIHHMYI